MFLNGVAAVLGPSMPSYTELFYYITLSTVIKFPGPILFENSNKGKLFLGPHVSNTRSQKEFHLDHMFWTLGIRIHIQREHESEDWKYVCDICESRFINALGLDTHKKLSHGHCIFKNNKPKWEKRFLDLSQPSFSS